MFAQSQGSAACQLSALAVLVSGRDTSWKISMIPSSPDFCCELVFASWMAGAAPQKPVLQPALLGLCQQPWTGGQVQAFSSGDHLWCAGALVGLVQALTELLGKSCPLTAPHNCSIYLAVSYAMAPKKNCIFFILIIAIILTLH